MFQSGWSNILDLPTRERRRNENGKYKKASPLHMSARNLITILIVATFIVTSIKNVENYIHIWIPKTTIKSSPKKLIF